MSGITGFRLRGDAAKKDRIVADSAPDTEAKDRVIAKMQAMGTERFDAMSEDEYGDWLNALPQDEFIALMGTVLDQENTGKP